MGNETVGNASALESDEAQVGPAVEPTVIRIRRLDKKETTGDSNSQGN